ncbi:MAG: hypothetical protein PF483_10805, partial [Halothiobacillus sp.]|nr:hypothetical protein [Halothiobacillus sp.]
QSERLLIECPQLFDLVWDALIRALSTESEVKWHSKPDRRWVDESRNRSAGRMVRALFKDPEMKTFESKAGLPVAWGNRLDQALSLPGDHGLHAIVMISSRLNRLYDIDPAWTEQKMLPRAECTGNENSAAFWSGYLWGSAPSQPLLYERLKPALIKLARHSKLSQEHANKLAEVFLLGWVWGDEADGPRQMISDIELREVLIHASDDLRTRVLLLLKIWAINSSAQLTHRLIPFLIQVWPKQRALRSEKMSQLLVDLAVSIPDRFPEIVEAILPRLVQIKGGSLSFLGIEDTVVARYPCVFLDLLWTVLGEDAANWPYKTSDMLAQLAEQAETQENPKLVELQRRERRV